MPENFLASLREGLSVRATAPAFPGRMFAGKVASIDSRVDMATRSVTVRALLANEDGALKPGMFLNVALANDEREALVIPEEALTPEAERQYVFVVADGKAQRREVRIGGRRPGSVEIARRPAAPANSVVVEGTQKVRDGARGDAPPSAPCDARAGDRRRSRTKPARRPARIASEPFAPMMISDLSVRRPVFATVMSLLLFILGLGAVTRLLAARIPRRRSPRGQRRDALSRRLAPTSSSRASRRSSRTRSPASKASSA